MEYFFITCSASILIWFAWQLAKAKKFTRFKLYLNNEIKDKVQQSIIESLNEQQSLDYPNNEHHQAATCYFWTQYNVRILQWALNNNILTEKQLKEDKQWRSCQHLFYIEQAYIVQKQLKLSDEIEAQSISE